MKKPPFLEAFFYYKYNMKIEIEHLVTEWKDLKKQWFNALRDCDDGRMKLLQKRMEVLESKIRIHCDELTEEEKRVIAWQVPPSAKWSKFVISHCYHKDL